MIDELDPISAAEQEMTAYAADVMAEAVDILHTIHRAQVTGRSAWRWGTGDPFETIEAARAIRQFPPSARPLDRPDDIPGA